MEKDGRDEKDEEFREKWKENLVKGKDTEMPFVCA